MATEFEYIVVGAGIEGSCTALALARAGKRTLLIDQYALGHDRGSSHGYSRITRKAYKEKYFTQLMDAAYDGWDEIAKEIGKQLYFKAGLLAIDHYPFVDLTTLEQTMISSGFPYEILEGPAIGERFPAMSYGPEFKALFDPSGGILKANVAVASIQELITRHGGVIRDKTKVLSVETSDPNQVLLRTLNGKEYIAKKAAVFCVGPWAPEFLQSRLEITLPILPVKLEVFYWNEKSSHAGTHSYDVLPPFIDYNTRPGYAYTDLVYGFPEFEFDGKMKIASQSWEVNDPNNDGGFAPNKNRASSLALVSEYVKAHFPGMNATQPEEKMTTTCYYTLTPDLAFIMDKHPKHKNVIIGAGFSGTGFKLGPVVGQILAGLAQGIESEFDLTAFKIDRFQKPVN